MKVRHVFQMVNINRKLGIIEDLPKEVDMHINVSFQYPLKLAKFKEKDVAIIASTISLTLSNVLEAIMKGESVLILSTEEKKQIEESIASKKPLPEDYQKLLMGRISRQALLLLTKANIELEIPPPIPLPSF